MCCGCGDRLEVEAEAAFAEPAAARVYGSPRRLVLCSTHDNY